MVADLIKLPLRLSAEATLFALRQLAAAGRLAIELVDHVVGDGSAAPASSPAPVSSETVFSGPEPSPRPAPARGPAPTPEAGEEEPEPAHISEEPELVAESADPGATDTATAEVTVEQPWDGYRRATARDVIALLAEATREELAVIQLYEITHRRRQSVLAAVELELKVKSPPRIS